MSRHATVVTVVGHRPLGTQGLHWPVTTTATVAWAECRCGATLTTVVRPDAPTDDAVALGRQIVAAARTEGVDPTAAQTAAGIVAEIMRAPEGVMGRHRASIVGGAAWEVRGELARGYAVRVTIEGGE